MIALTRVEVYRDGAHIRTHTVPNLNCARVYAAHQEAAGPHAHRDRACGMSALEPGLYRWSFGGKSYDGILDSDGDFSYLSSDGRHCTRGWGQHDTAHRLIAIDIATWFPHRAAAILADLDKMSLGDPGSDAFLIDVLTQIEAQTKPPRIPEPGLYGVVKSGAAEWTRLRSRTSFVDWISDGGTRAQWGEIPNPTLIRDGIEP